GANKVVTHFDKLLPDYWSISQLSRQRSGRYQGCHFPDGIYNDIYRDRFAQIEPRSTRSSTFLASAMPDVCFWQLACELICRMCDGSFRIDIDPNPARLLRQAGDAVVFSLSYRSDQLSEIVQVPDLSNFH
ncbi:MAG: hypothetical protein P1R58_13270, partial [bacterium]|nr:hypothetical protein [bacterium]